VQQSVSRSRAPNLLRRTPDVVALPNRGNGDRNHGVEAVECLVALVHCGNDCRELGLYLSTLLAIAASLKDLSDLAAALVPSHSSIPLSHHAFKHSQASMISSPNRVRAGVIIFFALLNTHSHSADIAGIASLSRAA
jgi:hypothetical protein